MTKVIQCSFLKDKDKKNLIWLTFYWIVTSSVFVYLLKDKFDGGEFFWANVIIFSPFVLIFVCNKFSKMLSFLLIFYSILLFLIINFTGLSFWRLKICAASIIFFIVLFNVVLYSEEPTKSLAHCRYLEYLRTSIWAIVFSVAGYYHWLFLKTQDQMEAKLREAGEIAVKYPLSVNQVVISYPTEYTLGLSIIQMSLIVFCGIILLSYTFHIKLREIEEKCLTTINSS